LIINILFTWLVCNAFARYFKPRSPIGTYNKLSLRRDYVKYEMDKKSICFTLLFCNASARYCIPIESISLLFNCSSVSVYNKTRNVIMRKKNEDRTCFTWFIRSILAIHCTPRESMLFWLRLRMMSTWFVCKAAAKICTPEKSILFSDRLSSVMIYMENIKLNWLRKQFHRIIMQCIT